MNFLRKYLAIFVSIFSFFVILPKVYAYELVEFNIDEKKEIKYEGKTLKFSLTDAQKEYVNFSDGKIEALKVGYVDIEGTAEDGSNVSYRVKINMTVPSEHIILYDSEKKTAGFYAGSGVEADSLKYTTSDAKCAEVDSNGVITRKSKKNEECVVTISAQYNSIEKSVIVEVRDAIKNMILSDTKKNMNVGQTHFITIKKIEPESAKDETIVWTSSNPKVATVSEGKVVAKKEGEAIIYAKSGGLTAQVEIKVVSENYQLDLFYMCRNQCGTIKVFRVLNIILNIIKVLVPLLLIVLGSIDLGKAVVSNDDMAIKKATETLTKRVIAGVVIFFIPTIIKFVFSLVDSATAMVEGSMYTEDINRCTKCLNDLEKCDYYLNKWGCN